MKIYDRVVKGIVSTHLNYLTRAHPIERYLKRDEATEKASLETIDKSSITVAAIQLEMRLIKNPISFAKLMEDKVAKAKNMGAQLIVFPEYNGIQLLGMLPGIEKLGGDYIGEKSIEGSREGIKVLDILKVAGPYIDRVMKTTFAYLAEKFAVHIMTGSLLAPDSNGKVYNIGYLYDAQGQLIGQQRKSHLIGKEIEWGVDRDTCISTYDTELGRIAFPICMDATYYETFRILENNKTDIAIIPIANSEDYNYWLAHRGIWCRVQESSMYGIKSAMVGKLFGMEFTGKSGIFAPAFITASYTGVVAESKYFDQEDVVVASIDINRLDEDRNNNDILGDRNFSLYKKYFKDIYK